jgi:signal peptidase I
MVLALSVCSYWIVSSCLVSIVVVQGRSMEPTLQDGSQHLLNRLAYLCRAPERGELVVLRDPGHGDCAVKRIVALPGESVELKDQRLYVNGRRLAEPYLRAGTATRPRRQPFPFRLGRDQYFVLGDNRSNSEDSRIYGAVSRGQILGCLFE